MTTDASNTTTPRSPLRELVRLTAGYSITSFIGPIFTIILTPLYMRVFSPTDYAILDITLTLGTLLMTLGMLGLHQAAATLFYDGDELHGRRVVSTATVIAVICTCILALLIALIAQPLAAALFGTPQWAILLYLSALNLPFIVFYTMCQSILRLRMVVKLANILALTYMVLTFSCIAFFVLGLRQGVIGVQIATVLVSLLLAMLGFVLMREQWVWPSQTLVRSLVLAGLPLIPAGLSFWALAYIDRFFLRFYDIPLTEIGLYAVATKLASLLTLIIVPFQYAWRPLALSMQHEPSAQQTYSKVLTYYTIFGLGMALILGLFAHEIFLTLAWLIDKTEYIPASPYVSLLVYYVVANGAMVAVSIGAYITKRTDILGWTMIIGVGINVLLNIILIPLFGVWGAAWATAIGYMSVPIAIYVVSRRTYPIPFEISKILIALVIQASLMATGILNETNNLFVDIPLKLFLLASYCTALVVLRVLEPDEVRAIIQIIRQPQTMLSLVTRK